MMEPEVGKALQDLQDFCSERNLPELLTEGRASGDKLEPYDCRVVVGDRVAWGRGSTLLRAKDRAALSWLSLYANDLEEESPNLLDPLPDLNILDNPQDSDDLIPTQDSSEASQALANNEQSDSLSLGYLGDEEDSNTLVDGIKLFGSQTKSLGEGKSQDESEKEKSSRIFNFETIISISSPESESPYGEMVELLSLSTETETESSQESQEKIEKMDI